MTSRRLALVLALGPSALAAQQVAEIQVAPPSVSIKVGERTGLLATAFDRIGNVIPTVRFIWSSNNVQIARVDNNGTVTGVASGVAIVEARVGTRRGTVAVQVTGGAPPAGPPQQTQAPANPAVATAAPAAAAAAAPDSFAGQPPGSGPAAALRVEPATVYLLPSENTRVGVRALRDDGAPAAPVAVQWRSLLPNIASVDGAGVVVALAPGQGTIQVSGPGGLTATAPVVVAQADFAIAERSLLLSPGDNTPVRVVVPSQNGRGVSPLALSWATSDPNVARVNLQGVVTAAGPGKATLTVTGLLQSRSIEVTVHKPVEVLVARPRSAGEITVPLSASAKFAVEPLAADNTPVPEAPVRWALSDTAVASFDVTTGTLTAKAIGRAQLSARAPGQGLVVNWTINVVAGEVRVTPARAGLSEGGRVVLRAEFMDERGNSLGPARVQWGSDNPTVAGVGADGAVTAGARGRTRIVASAAGGKSAGADIFVMGELIAARSRGARFELFGVSRDELTDPHRIGTDTLGMGDPAVSADGSRIAGVSLRDGNAELYVLDADGANITRVTNDPAVDGSPAFTPDGTSLLFHSDRGPGRRLQVYSVGLDGQGLRALTTDSTNSQPAVSPDGRTIAFVSTRDRNYDIWLMARDGSNQRRFTQSPQWNERHPRFLADGTLAYLVERREGTRTVTQVMRAELSTGTVTALSGTDLAISDFAVSRDGSLLALVVPATGQERRREPRFRLVLQPAGGGTAVEVPLAPTESMVSPTFLP